MPTTEDTWATSSNTRSAQERLWWNFFVLRRDARLEPVCRDSMWWEWTIR